MRKNRHYFCVFSALGLLCSPDCVCGRPLPSDDEAEEAAELSLAIMLASPTIPLLPPQQQHEQQITPPAKALEKRLAEPMTWTPVRRHAGLAVAPPSQLPSDFPLRITFARSLVLLLSTTLR